MLGSSATWISWCIIILTLIIMPSVATEEEGQVGKKLGFTTIKLDLNNVQGYDQFLNTLRNTVAAPTRSCNIAYTVHDPASADARYVLVKLCVSPIKCITLGIDAASLYVWAYQDMINGTERATFIADAPMDARTSLFLNTTRRFATYQGNYDDLERAASSPDKFDVTRETIALTFNGLENDIINIHGSSSRPGRAEAKFFLRAIQMVSEAARFRFLQKAIRDSIIYLDTEEFRKEVVAYEGRWDRISQAIHRAEATRNNKCQAITPTLLINNPNGYHQEVNNMNEIRDKMGLLKYPETILNANIDDQVVESGVIM